MNSLLLGLVLSALLSAAAGGLGAQSSAALMDGAASAVELCLRMAGGLCLWSAVLELMERCGLSRALAKALRPLLRRLFPQTASDEDALAALTENVGANLLGLGNAATPAGIRAAKGMAAMGAEARDELCLLVLLNTASIQLLPTTMATLRAAAGAASAFDILPAVWGSSLLALCAGLGAAALLRRVWP